MTFTASATAGGGTVAVTLWLPLHERYPGSLSKGGTRTINRLAPTEPSSEPIRSTLRFW